MKAKLFYGLLLSVMAMIAVPAMAQEEYGYKKINVVEDFPIMASNGLGMPSYLPVVTGRRAIP